MLWSTVKPLWLEILQHWPIAISYFWVGFQLCEWDLHWTLTQFFPIWFRACFILFAPLINSDFLLWLRKKRFQKMLGIGLISRVFSCENHENWKLSKLEARKSGKTSIFEKSVCLRNFVYNWFWRWVIGNSRFWFDEKTEKNWGAENIEFYQQTLGIREELKNLVKLKWTAKQFRKSGFAIIRLQSKYRRFWGFGDNRDQAST